MEVYEREKKRTLLDSKKKKKIREKKRRKKTPATRLWAQFLGTQGSSKAYTCLCSWTRVVPDESVQDYGYSDWKASTCVTAFGLTSRDPSR